MTGATKTAAMMSMTGFGRAQRQHAGLTIEVELRSVNHRFLDLTLKTPRIYSPFEADIRSVLGKHIGRGRVEVFVARRSTDVSALNINFNKGLFDKLSAIYDTALGADAQKSRTDIALNILARREVLEVIEEGGDLAAERTVLFDALQEAVTGLSKMRLDEGAHLQKDLAERLETLRSLRKKMIELSEKTPINYKEKLNQRLQRLSPEVSIDPLRLANEIALLCDRIDTTEEFVRLESHFEQFSQSLRTGAGSGRRLEFIIQEMGREFNTITSKAQDAAVQHLVIDAKAEVERIKEQVQNVE